MDLTPAQIAARLHDGPVQQFTAAQLFIELGIAELRKLDTPGLDEDSMLVKGLASLRSGMAATREIMGALVADEDP